MKTTAKTVLLIEDEPNIIEAVSFILSRDGWQVKTHSNGHDAMQNVRAGAPDLILLDVRLPGKSGHDILKEIRADADFAKTPVLMLTARGQEKDKDAADRAGADRYMTKPFSNADLLAAVRELIRS